MRYRYLIIFIILLPLLSAGQDMRLFPTVDDLSTFQGDYAWYNLSFWQKKQGQTPSNRPSYVMPGPVGFYFEKVGALNRPGGELWVEDFRTAGDTDADVWEKAIGAMKALKVPLRAGSQEYKFNRSIVVAGDFWHVTGTNVNGQGTVIKSEIPNYGPITSTTAADLSYPTPSYLGPMRGCAFYFTSLIYYSRTENLTFNDFRFAMAFQYTHNSPTFLNCTFNNGNVGVICYQGSQNFQYINCSTAGMNNLHISSATCFPSNSPYKNDDNYYTDGLAVKNEGGYSSFSCSNNPAFDTWFVASFLRPAIQSVSIGTPGGITYQGANGVTYASNSPYCTPSGRVVYVPMRNPRTIFGTQFHNVDVRGQTPRGFCLLNNTVANLVISGHIGFEGMFEDIADSTGYFNIGTAHNGLVDAPFTNLGYVETSHPLLKFSGRGYSSGHAEYSNKLDRSWSPDDLDREYIGKVKRTEVNDAVYTIQSTDYIVAYVHLTIPRRLYLPAASSMRDRSIIVKDETGLANINTITLAFTTAGPNNTIDGQISKALNTNYGTIRVYSNGTKWFTY